MQYRDLEFRYDADDLAEPDSEYVRQLSGGKQYSQKRSVRPSGGEQPNPHNRAAAWAPAESPLDLVDANPSQGCLPSCHLASVADHRGCRLRAECVRIPDRRGWLGERGWLDRAWLAHLPARPHGHSDWQRCLSGPQGSSAATSSRPFRSPVARRGRPVRRRYFQGNLFCAEELLGRQRDRRRGTRR